MELTSSTRLRSESGRLCERTLLGQRRIAHPPSPADLGTAFAVPRTCRWYVRAPDKYPWGKIDILPAAKGGIAGIFPHQHPFDVPSGVPYRGAKICVATDSEGNLRRDDQAEPRSAEDRLAWHIQRTIAWIESASKGTLLSPGDPFKLPARCLGRRARTGTLTRSPRAAGSGPT